MFFTSPISTATCKICLLSLFNYVSFILIISQHSPPLIDRQSVNFNRPFSICFRNYQIRRLPHPVVIIFVSYPHQQQLLAEFQSCLLHHPYPSHPQQNQGQLGTYSPLSQHHLCLMVVIIISLWCYYQGIQFLKWSVDGFFSIFLIKYLYYCSSYHIILSSFDSQYLTYFPVSPF